MLGMQIRESCGGIAGQGGIGCRTGQDAPKGNTQGRVICNGLQDAKSEVYRDLWSAG